MTPQHTTSAGDPDARGMATVAGRFRLRYNTQNETGSILHLIWTPAESRSTQMARAMFHSHAPPR
jgi:hypothetical protein